jgi:excisionase family DNA binding protein
VGQSHEQGLVAEHCPSCSRTLCQHCHARFCPHCGNPVASPIEAKLAQLQKHCRDHDIVVYLGTVGTKDAAALTGIPRDTLKRWLAEGKYPELKTKVGPRWRYHLKSLADFLVGDQKI